MTDEIFAVIAAFEHRAIMLYAMFDELQRLLPEYPSVGVVEHHAAKLIGDLLLAVEDALVAGEAQTEPREAAG